MTENVLTYLDYRLFLNDTFNSFKKDAPGFSFRAFARMAGSTSPNFLQFVTQKKLSLSQENINSLSLSFGFNSREKRYFETLVAFDHAKTHEEKDRYFRQIVSTREYGRFKQLHENQYQYLSHWYMPVIRELVVSPEYPGMPAWIADRLMPPISESKARKGIELLEKLGLIRKTSVTGKWELCDRIVSTPSEILSVSVVKYYTDLLGLARNSMETFPASERDIRGVTAGISLETYQKLKSRMESFWNEILAMANEEQETDRVYHVGIQLFPLSRDIKK